MIWCSAEGRAPTYYSYTSQIICRGAKPPSEVLFGSKFAAVLGAKIVKIIFFLLKFFTPFLQQFSEQELKKKFIFLKFFTPFLQQFWEQKLKKINTFPSFEVIHSICAAVLVAKIERKNNFFPSFEVLHSISAALLEAKMEKNNFPIFEVLHSISAAVLGAKIEKKIIF